jgi:hypothetical protein
MYDLGNPGSGLGQANSVEGLNSSMGFQSSHTNTDINKNKKNIKKNLNRFASNKKKPHTITKMNNNELFPEIHNNHNHS